MKPSSFHSRRDRLLRGLAVLTWTAVLISAGLFLGSGCADLMTPPDPDPGPVCSAGQYSNDDGFCAEECDENSCPEDQKCNKKTGECEPDCNDPGVTCEAEETCSVKGICEMHPCQQDPDSCSEGACDGTDCVMVACASAADCPNQASQQCKDGFCEAHCGAGTCDDDEVCDDGDCVDLDGLTEICDDVDDDCDGEDYCREGKCVSDCGREGCAGAMGCDEVTGCAKVNCASDPECPDGDKTGCNPDTNECEEKSQGGVCPAGSVLNLFDLCTLIACLNGVCPAGSSCDVANDVCVPTCFAENCPDGTSCDPMDGTCSGVAVTFLEMPQQVVQLSDQTVGAATEVELTFAIQAGELAASSVITDLGTEFAFDGFVGTGRPEGTVIGSVEIDTGSGFMTIHDVIALDSGTAFIDLQGDGQTDLGLDITLSHRDDGGVMSLAVVAPLGGNLTSTVKELAQGGDIRLRLFSGIYSTASTGLKTVSTKAVAVDPDTGGKRNYLKPDPPQKKFEETVAACNKEFDADVDGALEKAANYTDDTLPDGNSYICIPALPVANADLSTALTIDGVSSEEDFVCAPGCDLTVVQDSELNAIFDLDSGRIASSAATLFVGGNAIASGAAQLAADVHVRSGATLQILPGALSFDPDKEIINDGVTNYAGDLPVLQGQRFWNRSGGYLCIDTPMPAWELFIDNEPEAVVDVKQPSRLFLKDNDGTINAMAGGDVEIISPGALDQHSGLFTVDAVSRILFGGPVNITGIVSGPGTADFSATIASVSGGLDVGKLSIGVNGDLNLGTDAAVGEFEAIGLFAVLDGSGGVTVAGAANVNQATLQGSGPVLLNGTTSISNSSVNGRDVQATSTVNWTGDVLFFNGSRFISSGTTNLSDGRMFGYNGSGFENRGLLISTISSLAFNPFIDDDGPGDGPIFLQTDSGSTQVLSGLFLADGDSDLGGAFDIQPGTEFSAQNGRVILRPHTATNAGEIRFPGADVDVDGVRTISGASGTLDIGAANMEFEVRGPLPGDAGGHDQVVVEGLVDFGSVGDVTLIFDNYTAQAGDHYVFMVFGSATGSVDTFNDPPMPLGLGLTKTQTATELFYDVVVSPQSVDSTVTVVNSPTAPGESVAVQVEVTNDGANAIGNLRIDADAGGVPFTLDAVTPSSGTCTASLPVTCTYGFTAPTLSRSLTLLFTPQNTGDLDVTFTVQQSQNVMETVEVINPAGIVQETALATAGNGSSLVKGGMYEINPATGQETTFRADLISPGGAPGFAIVDETKAYADSISGFGSTSSLYEIDLTTDMSTLIGPITLDGTPLPVGDLAFDLTTGTLYGLTSQSVAGQLITIDGATGVATLVGVTEGAEPGSIAFAPDGTLFQFTNVRSLRRIDPTDASTLTEVPVDQYMDGAGWWRRANALVATGGGTMWLVGPDTGVTTELYPGPGGTLSDIDFLPGPPDGLLRFADQNTVIWSPEISPTQTWDLIHGDLNTLLAGGGDFTAAVEACDAAGTTAEFLDVSSVPGEASFLLLRPRAPQGSFDSVGSGQVGLRDAEIAASPNSCP